MFFFLKAGAEHQLPKWAIKEHGSGKKYVESHGTIADAIAGFPAPPAEAIDLITLKETIYDGFQPEGLYQDGHAKLVATAATYGDGFGASADCQEIAGSAPDLKSLAALYTRFRQGLIPPVEKWGTKYDAKPTAPAALKPEERHLSQSVLS